jgi:hypothetical protein
MGEAQCFVFGGSEGFNLCVENLHTDLTRDKSEPSEWESTVLSLDHKVARMNMEWNELKEIGRCGQSLGCMLHSVIVTSQSILCFRNVLRTHQESEYNLKLSNLMEKMS